MSGSGAAFAAFFDRYHAELSRLAYLLTGDATVADDLAAEALSRIRHDWPRLGDDPAADALGQVRHDWPGLGDDDPAARARGLVATLARRHERWVRRPGGSTPLDLRAALRRLPHRRRVCVVLRYAFGLTEDEVARALGIGVATVRSRTARGVRQLSALVGGSFTVTRVGGWEAAR